MAFAILGMATLKSNTAQAAFPIAAQEKVQNLNTTQMEQLKTIQIDELQQSAQVQTQKQHKKVGSSSAIPQGLYIVLAIFWLGWLAMGINDDWNGSDWLISLLLYILLWLPGFIYTLIKMNKYY